MGRFGAYGQRDRPWVQDGDAGWKGIDMIHDPGSVPPGYLIKAENKRMRDGTCSTRPGTTYPGDFNPLFENKIIGSAIYSNPNSDEVMLVATLNATYVWALQFGKDPVQINLSGGQNTGTNPFGLVQFVQSFNKVLLLRFPVNTPLVWDGNNANTFDPVTTPGPATLIPNVSFGQPFQNRVLLYSPYTAAVPWRDQFIMTDPNDYTQYDEILSKFRINSGESDMITCIQPYFKGSVIVFMRDSIHMLENFTIDPFLSSQRLLNSRLGSVSIRLPFMDGNDIIFLSRTGSGLYRISEIIQDEIAALPRPISWLIQPVIDRINWDQASGWACSEGVGDYAFFAVPLDGATGGCNGILVYNTITREWESAPDWFDDPDVRINALHATLFDKERRLFGLDYKAQRVYLLYDGLQDEVNGDSIPVHDRWATRGYVCGDPASFKRFERANIGLRTYNPLATISARSDGYNELKQLATVTKDRTLFYAHGHKRFDPATDDADEPRREDYAIADTDSAINDFEDLPDGDLGFIPGTPLIFTGNKQQTLERWQVRQNGRWCSIEGENTSGQCDVLGVAVDAITSQEGMHTLA